VICVIGFGIIFLTRNPIAGTAVIAIPTLLGMVIKPTFALCILMLVLPTGAGVGFREAFSLDRGVGVALAASFFLNVLLTRPGAHPAQALWFAAGMSVDRPVVADAAYLTMEMSERSHSPACRDPHRLLDLETNREHLPLGPAVVRHRHGGLDRAGD
jgi:hypothetical protein